MVGHARIMAVAGRGDAALVETGRPIVGAAVAVVSYTVLCHTFSCGGSTPEGAWPRTTAYGGC